MLSVTQEEIIKEVQTSSFLSIQADETTDIATLAQLVLVLRYIDDKNNVQERFFEFIPLQSATAESIATALKERIASILPEDQKSKLICQAYDGASVMGGATAGVQRKVQDVYPNAHYIHCYAHQLNLIMQQATSHISKTRFFFSNIGGFASFFSKSPKRTCFLDKVVAHRLPRSSNVRWNFHSRAINTVFEHREDLIHCFESIQDSGDFDPNTVREAGALAMLLEDDDFKFFLELYHHIMPHVDFLYAKLQKKNIDSVHIKMSIQQFQQEIQKIRNSLHSIGEQSSGSQPTKRRRVLSPEERERIGAELGYELTPLTSSVCKPAFEGDCETLFIGCFAVKDSKLTPLTSSVCKPASEEDCEKLFIGCFAVKDSKLAPLTSSVCKPASEEDCEKLFIGCFAVKDSKLTPLTSSVCKPAFEGDCETLFIGCFAVKDSKLTPLTSSVCKPASEEDCEKLFIACFAVKDSKLTPLTSSVCKPAFEEDCEKLFIGYFAVKDSKLTPLTSSVCKPAFEEDCEKLFIGYFAVKDSSSLCVSPPLRKTVRNCHWLLHSKRIQLVILSPVLCVCPPLGKTEGKAAAVWWAVKDLGQKTHAPGRKPPLFSSSF
ncbi:unnamed protein product [Leuciscus chuanchicus]